MTTTDRISDILTDFKNPILVRACAGSGKTRLLAAKCLTAILQGERPLAVAAITFTEKAAQELKDRVRLFLNMITEASGEAELELKDHLPWRGIRAAIQESSPHYRGERSWRFLQTRAKLAGQALIEQRFFVGTIHGFSKRLLDRYPLEALGGLFEHFDPSGKAIEELLEGHSARDLVEAVFDLGKISLRQLGALHKEMLDLHQRGMPLEESQLTLLGQASQNETFAQVWRRLAGLLEAVLQESRRLGYLNYDLMLFWLARFLETCDESVLEEIRSQVQYVLLDELQDTDPLQMGAIEILCGIRRGKNVQGGRLFMVGDQCQSIYSFRGASPHLIFEEKRLSRFKHWNLYGNKRSGPGVIEFVNRVFDGELAGFGRMDSVPLVGKKFDRVYWHRFKKPAALNAGESLKEASRREEARHAATIAQVLVHERSGRWSDVAILLRKMKYGWVYLDELNKIGIPVVLSASPGEILGMSLTARLLAWLAADLLEINPSQAAVFFEQFKGAPWGAILDNRLEVIERLRRDDLRRLSLGPLVSKLIQEFHLGETVQSWGSSEIKALEMTQELAWKSGGDLAAFLEKFWMKMDLSAGDEEDDSASAPGDGDGVRLMTIHKSKGLQFPVVILPGIADWTTRADSRRILWDPLSRQAAVALFDDSKGKNDDTKIHGWQQLKKTVQEENRHEEQRILYVAMTRAEETLVVMEPAPDLGMRSDAKLINQSLIRARDQAKDFECPSCRGETTVLAGKAPMSLEEKELLEKLRQIPAKETSGFILQPAILYASQKEPARDLEPGVADQSAQDETRLLGELLHAVMEEISWDGGIGQEQWGAILKRQAVLFKTREQGSMLEKNARKILTAFFESACWKEMASKKLIAREFPASFVYQGSLVVGRIDLIYEDAGELVVADYKTNASSALEHEAQGKAYLNALKGLASRLGKKKLVFEVISLSDAKSWRL